MAHSHLKHFRTTSILSLFDDKELCDVTFKVGNKKDWKVFHGTRALFAAHSIVFKRMLYGSMLESSSDNNLGLDDENQILITDISPLIFAWFMQFIYGLNPKINDSNVIGLFYFSEKYLIKELNNECINFMVCNVLCDKTNLCELLESLTHWGLSCKIAMILKEMKQYVSHEQCVYLLKSDFFLNLNEKYIIEWLFNILKIQYILSSENCFLAMKHWCKYQCKKQNNNNNKNKSDTSNMNVINNKHKCGNEADCDWFDGYEWADHYDSFEENANDLSNSEGNDSDVTPQSCLENDKKDKEKETENKTSNENTKENEIKQNDNNDHDNDNNNENNNDDIKIDTMNQCLESQLQDDINWVTLMKQYFIKYIGLKGMNPNFFFANIDNGKCDQLLTIEEKYKLVKHYCLKLSKQEQIESISKGGKGDKGCIKHNDSDLIDFSQATSIAFEYFCYKSDTFWDKSYNKIEIFQNFATKVSPIDAIAPKQDSKNKRNEILVFEYVARAKRLNTRMQSIVAYDSDDDSKNLLSLYGLNDNVIDNNDHTWRKRGNGTLKMYFDLIGKYLRLEFYDKQYQRLRLHQTFYPNVDFKMRIIPSIIDHSRKIDKMDSSHTIEHSSDSDNQDNESDSLNTIESMSSSDDIDQDNTNNLNSNNVSSHEMNVPNSNNNNNTNSNDKNDNIIDDNEQQYDEMDLLKDKKTKEIDKRNYLRKRKKRRYIVGNEKQLSKYVKKCAKTKKGVRFEYDTVVWQNTDYIMIHDTPVFSMFQVQFIPSASVFNSSTDIDTDKIFKLSRKASKEFVNIVKNVYYGMGLPRFIETRHNLKYKSTVPSQSFWKTK